VWSTRDLAAEVVCYLFMDGWYPRVRTNFIAADVSLARRPKR
jgi:hypothetical protein